MLIAYAFTMTALLYFRDVEGVSLSKNIFVVLVLSVSVFANYETLVSIICFTLPLMCGLPGNFFLPVWMLLVLYKLHQRKMLKEAHAITFVIILLFSEVMHILADSFDLDIMQFVGYSCSLLLVSVFAMNNTRMEYHLPVIMFCVGCCVLLAIVYLMYSSNPMLMYVDGGVRMGGDSNKEDGVMSLATNANNIGYLSSASIACAFALFYYKKLSIAPFLLIFIISFYCGMFSVSRTWVLTIAIILFSYFMMNKQDRIYGYTMLTLMVVGGIYYFLKNPDFLNMFLDRFSGDEIETGGQRTTLFAEYNKFLGEHVGNMFLGTGALMYKEVARIGHATHNGLQQIWVSYGIFGFIFIVFAYIKALKINYCPKQYMSVMPMIAIFFFLQTIQILNPYNGMYPLIAAFFVMKMVKQDEVSKFTR